MPPLYFPRRHRGRAELICVTSNSSVIKKPACPPQSLQGGKSLSLTRQPWLITIMMPEAHRLESPFDHRYHCLQFQWLILGLLDTHIAVQSSHKPTKTCCNYTEMGTRRAKDL